MHTGRHRRQPITPKRATGGWRGQLPGPGTNL